MSQHRNSTPASRQERGYTDRDERAMLDVIGRWVERDVKPHVMQMERDDIYPHAFVEQMKEFGLFGATISERYGGLGLRAATYARIVSLISEQWMSLTGIFNSHLMMATIVEKYGTDAQREYWLPKFVTGEIRGGLALTEPDAGTDLQGIRTRAVACGDGYRIDGTKTWISNGIEGGAVALLVKTDPDASPPRRGMSMFIAPKADPDTGKPHPGFRTGRKLEKLGYHGIDSAELVFENYQLDAERHLVGGEPGKGFYMAVGGLELGRSTSRHARSALPAGPWTRRRPTRKPARPSASPSRSIRPFNSSWVKWPPAPAPPNCSPRTPPAPTTPVNVATWRPAWPSTSPPRAP